MHLECVDLKQLNGMRIVYSIKLWHGSTIILIQQFIFKESHDGNDIILYKFKAYIVWYALFKETDTFIDILQNVICFIIENFPK